MSDNIPLMKARVEIHIDNKDKLIEWCKEALRKEGVEESAFETAMVQSYLDENEGDVRFEYKVDNWIVCYTNNINTGSGEVRFQYLEQEHRIHGPSLYQEYRREATDETSYERNYNYYINGEKPLFPKPFRQADNGDGSKLYFASKGNKRYNVLVISITIDKKFKYCSYEYETVILQQSKEIVEFLINEYNVTLTELLTHPVAGVRKIAEESIKV